METLSLLIMIPASLFAYSAGAVSPKRDRPEPRPRLADLFLVLLVWTGGIWSRSVLSGNLWLPTAGWLVAAYLVGRLAWLVGPKTISRSPGVPARPSKNLWLRWKAFSRKAGGFQTRLILGFFFFLVAAPFGLAVKIFRDPLRLRKDRRATYWLAKKETADDLERARRQS